MARAARPALATTLRHVTIKAAAGNRARHTPATRHWISKGNFLTLDLNVCRKGGKAALRRRRFGPQRVGPARPADDRVLRGETPGNGGSRGGTVSGTAGPRVSPAVRQAAPKVAGFQSYG